MQPAYFPESETPSKTVISAKKVELSLISYVDESGVKQTQLGVIGDNNVILLEAREMGLSKNTTPKGIASTWLRDGIFKALNRPVKEAQQSSTPPAKKKT